MAISFLKKHREALEKERVAHAHRLAGIEMNKDFKDGSLICSFTKNGKVIIPPPSEGMTK